MQSTKRRDRCRARRRSGSQPPDVSQPVVTRSHRAAGLPDGSPAATVTGSVVVRYDRIGCAVCDGVPVWHHPFPESAQPRHRPRSQCKMRQLHRATERRQDPACAGPQDRRTEFGDANDLIRTSRRISPLGTASEGMTRKSGRSRRMWSVPCNTGRDGEPGMKKGKIPMICIQIKETRRAERCRRPGDHRKSPARRRDRMGPVYRPAAAMRLAPDCCNRWPCRIELFGKKPDRGSRRHRGIPSWRNLLDDLSTGLQPRPWTQVLKSSIP